MVDRLRALGAGRVLLVAAAVLVALAVVVALLPRRPVAPAASPVALTAPDRVELRENLEAGGAAGIAAYLVTHPSPPSLRGATSFTTREVHGTGDATERIGAAEVADLATVLLVSASTGTATWTLLGADGEPLGTRGQDVDPGVLTAATVRVPADEQPLRLRIDAGEGVRWGAAVVLSDRPRR